VTRSHLAADLRRLGVQEGGITMVHTRMSAIGWVVGGSETVVRALLDALGPEGTLMAYASWAEHVYRPTERASEHRDAYLEEPPVFDVATGEVDREYGRIPERVRTWPGALRSAHPEAGVVAVGPRAKWLTEAHPANDAYGRDSPFARLVEAGGEVLLLGAPLDTVTLLHHAEAIAEAPGKRTVTYLVVVAERGLDDDPFAVIARAALTAGIGVRGHVGQAESHLFPAPELTSFAVSWIEDRFPHGAAH
jgi:aminoglycoside 3-N-acetyltransferase